MVASAAAAVAVALTVRVGAARGQGLAEPCERRLGARHLPSEEDPARDERHDATDANAGAHVHLPGLIVHERRRVLSPAYVAASFPSASPVTRKMRQSSSVFAPRDR